MTRRISHVRAAREFGKRLGCTRDPRWLIMLQIAERLDRTNTDETPEYALAQMAKEIRAIARDLENAATKKGDDTAKSMYDSDARQWGIAPPRQTQSP